MFVAQKENSRWNPEWTHCNNSHLMPKFSRGSKGDLTKTWKRGPGQALFLKACPSWEIPWNILLKAGKMLWGISLPVCHGLTVLQASDTGPCLGTGQWPL